MKDLCFCGCHNDKDTCENDQELGEEKNNV